MAFYPFVPEDAMASAGVEAGDLDTVLTTSDVIVTPHAAFYSEEATVEQQRKAAEQVVAALDGEVPVYAVNPEAFTDRSQQQPFGVACPSSLSRVAFPAQESSEIARRGS